MKNVLNKLKYNIDKALVIKFEYNLLEQMKFVPISVKNEIAYVAINPFANKEEILTLFDGKNLKTKYIQLTEEEIEELLSFVKELYTNTTENVVKISSVESDSTPKEENLEKNIKTEIPEKNAEINNQPLEQDSSSPQVSAKPPQKKRLGELLIEAGIITDAQLVEALSESKRQEIPLGSTLYKLGFITLAQLKENLEKQQGLEAVDSSTLNIQEKVIKMLPEDFIKANKVIPISTDGRNLVVGMVNPGDTKVLKDIVYLTGQKPRAMIITHVEFQNCIETIYNTSKKETKEIIEKIENSMDTEIEETLWEQVE